MNNSQQELIFALDIGTRSVIGVVGQARGDMFHVLYMAKEEHSKRAMMDGQIEDIDQVAKVVQIVKERLEQQIGQPLTRVCVAAAGRSLRMERARAVVELPKVQKVTEDFISQLEAVAIAEAESKLSENHKDQRFYLVGYTVAEYQLDRYTMGTIKGHKGRVMEAEVVATFLPSQVVEGLYSVVKIAGMDVASLTLEPIAALNSTIPPDLRLLNLVLVDIGAGTSDIAVCRDGSVVGYTMATTAGDEITEMLMKHFLIDFRTAENLKTNMSGGDIKYTDVLGLEQTTSGKQIAEAIGEASKSLVKEISKEIRSINGCSPSAVFMAGGGSKLDGLSDLLASYLEMPSHRIAVAGSNYNRTVVAEDYELEDPEYATPLGIAVSSALGLINDSYHITLNGKSAKLFRSGSLTLLDILMMNGYTAAALIGRTGKSLAILINGNKKLVRGTSSVPGILRLNGEPSVARALVSAGDNIEFTPAIDGVSATCTLQELLGDYSGKVLLNGEEVPWDTMLKSGDSITTINSNVSVTSMRRTPRAVSATELQPVDSHGNPVELEQRFYGTEGMDPVTESSILSVQSPSAMDGEKDVKIYQGDNITPLTPPNQGAEEMASLDKSAQPAPVEISPQPKKSETEAVLKAVPDSLGQPLAEKKPEEDTGIIWPVREEKPLNFGGLEEPESIMEQMPVEEKPVMPTGPLPVITADMVEDEKKQGKEIKSTPKMDTPKPQPVMDMPQPVPLTPPEPQIVEVPQPVPLTPPQSKAVEVPQPLTPPEPQIVEVPQPLPTPEPQAVDEASPEEVSREEETPEASQGNKKPYLTQGTVVLNGKPLQLPPKVDGSPYYLMDLLDKTDIDFRRVTKPIHMLINDKEGYFVQHLYANDNIIIEEGQ